MRVLCIGDVVSPAGISLLRRKLPALKAELGVRATIVNGENASVGNGLLPADADALFAVGADVVTGGNHTLQRREILPYFDEHPQLLRPANLPESCPGGGVYELDFGSARLAVISLMGQVFFTNPPDSPFAVLERLLRQITTPFVLVDFHAESTGEKLTLAHAFDGRASAIVGTHTHVPTADEQILPQGTGYISDLGMTGPFCSVLGIDPACTVSRMRDHLPTRFHFANTPPVLQGVWLDLDDKTGKCTRICRVFLNES